MLELESSDEVAAKPRRQSDVTNRCTEMGSASSDSPASLDSVLFSEDRDHESSKNVTIPNIPAMKG